MAAGKWLWNCFFCNQYEEFRDDFVTSYPLSCDFICRRRHLKFNEFWLACRRRASKLNIMNLFPKGKTKIRTWWLCSFRIYIYPPIGLVILFHQPRSKTRRLVLFPGTVDSSPHILERRWHYSLECWILCFAGSKGLSTMINVINIRPA